jgi:uncharacterized protein (DUF1015 family)
MNITQSLKNKSINGAINADAAIKIAGHFDIEREMTITLLKECERNVGMYLGEKINVLIARMEGVTFDSVGYHYEKPTGEQ